MKTERLDQHGLPYKVLNIGQQNEFHIPELFLRDKEGNIEFNITVPAGSETTLHLLPMRPEVNEKHLSNIEFYRKCGKCMVEMGVVNKNGIWNLGFRYTDKSGTKSSDLPKEKNKPIWIYFNDGEPQKRIRPDNGNLDWNIYKAQLELNLKVELV